MPFASIVGAGTAGTAAKAVISAAKATDAIAQLLQDKDKSEVPKAIADSIINVFLSKGESQGQVKAPDSAGA